MHSVPGLEMRYLYSVGLISSVHFYDFYESVPCATCFLQISCVCVCVWEREREREIENKLVKSRNFPSHHGQSWPAPKIYQLYSSCVPTLCTVIYSIGRAYVFGFSQAWFSRKVPGRNVWIGLAVVVEGREGMGGCCIKIIYSNIGSAFAVRIIWSLLPQTFRLASLGFGGNLSHCSLSTFPPSCWDQINTIIVLLNYP